jgi:hypothetical protein
MVTPLPTAPTRNRGKPTEASGATTLLVNCMSRVTSWQADRLHAGLKRCGAGNPRS